MNFYQSGSLGISVARTTTQLLLA